MWHQTKHFDNTVPKSTELNGCPDDGGASADNRTVDCMWTVAATTQNPEFSQEVPWHKDGKSQIRFTDLPTTKTALRSRNRGGARSPGFPSCVPVSGWAVARSVGRSGDPRPQSGTDAPLPPPTVAENDGTRQANHAKANQGHAEWQRLKKTLESHVTTIWDDDICLASAGQPALFLSTSMKCLSLSSFSLIPRGGNTMHTQYSPLSLLFSERSCSYNSQWFRRRRRRW